MTTDDCSIGVFNRIKIRNSCSFGHKIARVSQVGLEKEKHTCDYIQVKKNKVIISARFYSEFSIREYHGSLPCNTKTSLFMHCIGPNENKINNNCNYNAVKSVKGKLAVYTLLCIVHLTW